MTGLARATSYERSVGSCGPPTPTTAPPHPAPAASVRRQLDFSGAGDVENEDVRAPACVCGRGVCVVERDDESGRWKFVCPSYPRCKHVVFYEEVDLNPKSQPSSWNHPEPVNPCAFNFPSNRMAGPGTPVSIRTQVTGAATPDSVRPQVAGATTLFSGSPQCAGATTLANISNHGGGTATLTNDIAQGVGAVTPAKFIPKGAFAATPAKVSPQGAGAMTLGHVGGTATLTSDISQGGGATTLAKFIPQDAMAATPAKLSPQGAKSNEPPVCQCTAGKCRKQRISKEDWYVCTIPKGKGACSYRVLVRDFDQGIGPSAQATPCDETHQVSPSMLHQPTATVNTPPISPMRPFGNPSPITPN